MCRKGRKFVSSLYSGGYGSRKFCFECQIGRLESILRQILLLGHKVCMKQDFWRVLLSND